MTEKTSKYYFLPILAVLLVVLFIVNITLGSVLIPIKESVNILLGNAVEVEAYKGIIWNLRLPKAITAVFAGGGLAISGLIMQTIFRNPLAGPFVLGVSSGASLGVAILLLTSSSIFGWYLGMYSEIVAALIGAISVIFIVMSASLKVKNNVALLILGLMFGSFSGAIVSILQYFSRPEELQTFVLWSMGSLGKYGLSDLQVLIILVLLTSGLTFILQKGLNLLLLGETYAQTSGANVKQLRLILLLLAGVLAGIITAYCGPLAFIGIAVPHFARILFNSSDHKQLIPACFLLGSCLLLICDCLAQVPGSSLVLPINAVTSLFGAPVVVWIVIRSRKFRNSI